MGIARSSSGASATRHGSAPGKPDLENAALGAGPTVIPTPSAGGSLDTATAPWEAGGRSRRERHWPALDGLRAVAVLAVIGIHVGVLPGGYLGVDVFFVLSGFLITTLLIEEWEKRGEWISFRRFYMRRALRLFPALGCVILAGTILAAVLDVAGGPPDHPYAAATFTEIPWVLAFASDFAAVLHHDPVNALEHTWSLAVEEQFYLVWPALFVLLMRRRFSRGLLALWLAVLAVAEMVYRAFLADLGYGHARIYFAPDTHSDGLLLGCAIAFWLASGQSARWQRMPGRLVKGTTWLGVVVLGILFVIGDSAGAPLYIPLAVLAMSVVVIGVVTGNAPGTLTRLLCSEPAVSTGRRSYGLYLWHVVLIAAAEALSSPYTGIFPAAQGVRRFVFAVALAAAIAGSFVVASLSYRFVELPALRLKRRF